MNKRNIGQNFEQAAQEYLARQGIGCIERNFNCKMGEIDLICKDKDTFIFVEVRYRSASQYGNAAATISASKQNKVRKAAMMYLKLQGYNIHHTAIRFDVITIDGEIDTLNWIKNAF
ncbi:YraN family protein [Catenovulum sediminis]|uniref:UPF0102 protein ABS311_06685 n=1 Tax=Catenovulum sediminis TaxID=1740262 RepID=A0ABV1RF74_9ALTE|nr:YraN family protein [Catenovulum sediminis]